MDARPCRPRGAENAIDQLHQRQKSAGTLANMLAAAPVAGLRGQAKRAAFGDVTNVSKGLLSSARDDPKASSLKPSTINISSTLPSTIPSTILPQAAFTANAAAASASVSTATATTTTTTITTSTSTIPAKTKPPVHMSTSQNKENAPFLSKPASKDTQHLSRPAQRPAAPPTTNPSKLKTTLAPSQHQDHAARRPVTASVVQDASANFYKFDFEISHQQEPHQQQQHQQTQQHARSNAASNRKMPASQGPADAPPRQPRHHKSQPQLKQQQPTLRRTQSKLDKADPLSENSDKLESASTSNTASTRRTSTDSSAMAATCDELSSDHAYLDSLCISIDTGTRAASDKSDDFIDLNIKLPGISEEPAGDSSFKGYPALSFSEAEENWDYEDDEDEDDEDNIDDDDDYDEQDQAYTTNYSTKSRDHTTANVTTMLAPRVNARVQLELDSARLEVERTRPPEDIEEEAWDVSMVAEYGDEIFAYMRELEIQMSPNPDYMDIQSEIQWSMRSVLMDWVVQVHNRFNLLPETLFLTVNYIDRFLSCKVVSIGKLQLVGATAILVASKYEEINCPSLEEIVYMVDGGYTTEEVLKAERFMLSMLSFELGWPGPMSFLRRVSKADDYDLETRTLAKYFMELTIMDERFVASPPSFVAAGAHCLSRLILNKGFWTKHHVHYSGYTWSQLKSLTTMMIECCENPKQHHSAIFDKYKEKRFREASLLVQRALDAGFTLPHHSHPIRRPAVQPALLNGVLDQPRTGVFLPV